MRDHLKTKLYWIYPPTVRRVFYLTLAAIVLLVIYACTYSWLRVKLDRGNGAYVTKFPTGGAIAELIFAPAVNVERVLDDFLQKDAEHILTRALSQAKMDDKRVLLVFGTTSCLPCRRLDELFEDVGPTFNKHFVIAKIHFDVMKNGGAVHLRYREEDDRPGMYMPWMVILDDDGMPLITSDGPDGIIALPQGSEKSRAYFLDMLRQTAPRITKEELREIDRAAKAMHDRNWKSSSKSPT